MEFQIEDNIAYPKGKNKLLYELVRSTFIKLEVGQSFLVPASNYTNIKPKEMQSRLTYHLKNVVALLNKEEKINTKYTTSCVYENKQLIGVRIWKTR